MTRREQAQLRFLSTYGAHLHDLLCEVALRKSLPEWVMLAAAGLGIELGGVLGVAAEVEIESRGDLAARKAGRG